MADGAPEGATPEVEWLNDAEQQAWRALVTGISIISRQLNSDLLAAHDLSVDDYGILAMLSEATDDRLRFGELANILRVPKAHVTYRFRRLEKQGLVTREVCETDARGAFAVLTPAGRARIETAAPSHVASVRRLVIDNLTAAQLAGLEDAMRAIVDADSAEAPDRF
ncbi:MarR family winged helix-turn-helix transcriptional regulator [Euzebya tangerina]|uniref:MarR family winged helix-turn-helix transcriptional regulator n=1 Tax=Euzebya tangerina TaxID=591198 RepID=UPI000E3238E5|nr:MarR family transcriptional regulator [Euzebya tangerina]